MKVIYTGAHERHSPCFQVFGSGLAEATEVPGRMAAIRRTLDAAGGFQVVPPGETTLDALGAVHDPGYLDFLENAFASWANPDRDVEIGIIPDTFAMRTALSLPESIWRQAGYYCFETQTPIVSGTWSAAVSAARCAEWGARLLIADEKPTYVLCRPPGHHASRDLYGGYCYLNNAAIAAHTLGESDRVAILDVDYHHGNGTQSIFYRSEGVLTVSIHADPNRAYPFYSGYEEEKGEGAGAGTNHNFPLEADVDRERYLSVLDRALDLISAFGPVYLVVSLGTDIYGEDPLSDFGLATEAFGEIGSRVRSLGLPTLVVQEGGYDLGTMGDCVTCFLTALAGMPL